MSALLRAEQVDKHYGGVHALADVSLEVAAGEVHALMGENGAGKSTLGKIIAGVVNADHGRLFFGGQPVNIQNPLDARRHGIGIIFQELDLFPNLTVAENIGIANGHIQQRSVVNFRHLHAACRPYLRQVGLDIPGDTQLGDLPIGHMQLVAIARALSMNAKLIVMDEPTSSLTDDAVDNLFELIARLKRTGVAIIYVSHKMDEIFRIADRITVLRDGQYIATKEASQTDVHELIRMMVGREVADTRRSSQLGEAPVLLSVRDLSTSKLRGVTFDLRAGEVLGVAGLVGAGRSELGHALFGLDKILSGTLRKRDRPLVPRGTRHAMRAGVGLLPEDRKLQGLMMQMSVKENASISVLSRLRLAGFVRQNAERDAVDRVGTRTRLKAASPDVPVSTLSGGNQQKVLLARWLLVDPDIFFLDDPTRGVDVGAKQDIYGLIDEMARAGKGVIFVSSELPELLHNCDRIMVLHDGRLMGILDAADATQENIMAMATRTVQTQSV